MKPNKLRLDPNGPWDPTSWVGFGPAVHLGKLSKESKCRDCATKTNAAILRAYHHDSV